MSRVYVTGLGVVSSLGLGHEAYWQALLAGQSAVSEIEHFDTTGFTRTRGAEVKGFRPRDFLTAAEAKRTGRCSAFALAAARMAMEHAGLAKDALVGSRAAVIMGTTMGEADVIAEMETSWLRHGEDAVPQRMIPRYGTTLLPIHIARAFGTRGMVQTLPAACAAGNYAIGYAADQIRAGRVAVAITGASEIIDRTQYAGFMRLSAMSPDRCRPFDRDRQGLILGEGAGVLILESEEHARARGATLLAEVGGVGLACDAHHITRPHPSGQGSVTATRYALRASGIGPDAVDHINAHGTGTPANDPVESNVIRTVFGDRPVPVTSIKSMLGHCMGASSAVEAVACVLTVRDDIYPPTIHYENPDPGCPVKVVANAAQAGRADIVLNNAAAFGGYDAVLCLAKPGRLPPLEERTL